MTSRRIRAIAMLGLAMFAAAAAPPGRQSDDDEPQWGSYGGDPGGTRHSPLTQIDRDNVGRLKIAWTYRTGERRPALALRSADRSHAPLLGSDVARRVVLDRRESGPGRTVQPSHHPGH